MELWIEANKTLDMKILLISGKFNLKHALEARQRIQDLIIDNFGVSDKLKSIFKKKLWIETEWEKVYSKGERHRIVFIQIAEKELEILENDKEVTTYLESVLNMKMATKMNIDHQKMSIEEYFTTIKIIEKHGRSTSTE